MEWAIIGTWKMALEGIEKATDILRNKGSSGDAVEYAINMVEDDPNFESIGYGGLLNEKQENYL